MPCSSAHLRLSRCAPIIVQGNIGVDCIDVVLAEHREQHTGGSHQRAHTNLSKQFSTGYRHKASLDSIAKRRQSKRDDLGIGRYFTVLRYLIVSVTCWLCAIPPLVAVMVKVNVPVGALWLALTVSVDEPEPVIEAGLKLALVRRGNPPMLRVTEPVNPLPAETLTV